MSLSWFDCEDLLTYQTAKVVVIRDRMLGLLRILGIVGIILYFSVKCMLVDQAYFIREKIVGVVEMSLRVNASNKIQVSRLSYCKGGKGGVAVVLPCVSGPDGWVAPSVSNTNLFASTRITDIREGVDPLHMFVQDIESYTVGISFMVEAFHSRRTTDNPGYSKDIKDLKTHLFGLDGTEMPANSIRRVSRFDVIELRTLLNAAGLWSLDTEIQKEDGAERATIRSRGAVLILNIDCPMGRDGTLSECNYEVNHVQGSEAKVVLPGTLEAHLPGRGRLVEQERRGLSVRAFCSGEMGRFDWTHVMISWVAAVGMYKLCEVFVDLLLTKFMPLKEVYNSVKYEHSVDFSEYRQNYPHAIAAVEYVQEENRRRRGLSETDSAPDQVYYRTELSHRNNSSGIVDASPAVVGNSVRGERRKQRRCVDPDDFQAVEPAGTLRSENALSVLHSKSNRSRMNGQRGEFGDVEGRCAEPRKKAPELRNEVSNVKPIDNSAGDRPNRSEDHTANLSQAKQLHKRQQTDLDCKSWHGS